jgi:hypothetical protein
MIYTNLHVELVCSSGTTIWHLGEEGKDKRMIDSTILKCITSMPVEDLKKCTESC